jgi:hypothetical protein
MKKTFTFLMGLVLAWSNVHGQSSADLNEGSQIEYDVSTGMGSFSWWGHPGKTYFIQHSPDLDDWFYLDVIVEGDDTVKFLDFTTSAEKGFYRLKYTTQAFDDPLTGDADGDKIGNWDELMQDTDPFLAQDSDFDGMPDDWELFYLGHATNGDPLGNGDGDLLTNEQEFYLGLNPNNPQTGAEPDGMGDDDGDGFLDYEEARFQMNTDADDRQNQKLVTAFSYDFDQLSQAQTAALSVGYGYDAAGNIESVSAP